MSSEADFVDVYYANQDLKGPPAFRVPRADAREQVNFFMATWKNKAKAIQMNYTMAALHRPARSLTMGPDVIFAVACGSEPEIALMEGWRAA